ncbi:MAG TPA: hypothetical protein VNX28_16175 [Gemmataceae bacterium]|jgi:hypothetical protein|nr:hypothetical protein [Gemmataceae bacterium]
MHLSYHMRGDNTRVRFIPPEGTFKPVLVLERQDDSEEICLMFETTADLLTFARRIIDLAIAGTPDKVRGTTP